MGRRHIAGIYREKHFWLAVLAIAVCVVLYITPAEWTYAGGEDCAFYEGTITISSIWMMQKMRMITILLIRQGLI